MFSVIQMPRTAKTGRFLMKHGMANSNAAMSVGHCKSLPFVPREFVGCVSSDPARQRSASPSSATSSDYMVLPEPSLEIELSLLPVQKFGTACRSPSGPFKARTEDTAF